MGRNRRVKGDIRLPYLPIIQNGDVVVPYCFPRQNHCSTSRDICNRSCTSYQHLVLNEDTQYFTHKNFNLRQLTRLIDRKPDQPNVLLTPPESDEHGILYIPFCTLPMHPGVPNERKKCLDVGCGRLHRLELAFEEPPVIKLDP